MVELVKDLDTLLSKHLSQHEVIKDTNYSRLTAPGDNYGSVMLKLDVTILNEDTKEERVLNLVAKTLPETEAFRQIFRIQITYTNEMAFYDIIVPTLQAFQKEIGVGITDNFAECFGTRKNIIKDSDVIGDDAVLLLQNLRVQGYTNADRRVGFDLESTKFILTDVARFHGSFLALKLQRPETFDQKVRPYCYNFEPQHGTCEYSSFFKKVFQEISKEDEMCSKMASKVKFWGEVRRGETREPFATVIHTDMWTNNTMQRFEDGKLVSNKFVDFQVYTYGSPAVDVFFFLWTSVQKPVLENHLDDLLHFYFEELIKTLKNHQCDPAPFTYDIFMNELKLEAGYGFPHSIQFLFMLGLAKDEKTIYEDVTVTAKNAPVYFKEKVFYMIRECEKRGWIY